MQNPQDPLAQMRGQLTDLGVAVVMQEREPDAVPPDQSQRHALALTLSLALSVAAPASPPARPVTAATAANDNAEG